MGLPNYQNNNQEEEQQESPLQKLVKQQAKRKGKKIAKKFARKAAKLAVKAAKQLGASLIKVLMSFLAGLGLPTILIAALIIIGVIIISLAMSFFFSSGDGLTGEDKELHEYIVKQADSTVDLNDPFQKKYRVPHALIASVIQIDALRDEDAKDLAKDMAKSLAPTFDYGKYNEFTQKQTQVCEDGVCKPWSSIKQTDKWVSKLDNVDFWNGYTSFTHEAYLTEWKYDTKITYRTDRWTETEKYTETVVEKYVEYEEVSRTVLVQVPYTETVYEPYVVIEYKYIEKRPGVYIRVEVPVTKYRAKQVTRYETKKVIVKDKVPVERSKEKKVEKTREVEMSKVVEIKTTTRTRQQKFNSTENTTEDYSYFDQILNSQNFGTEDKKLIEINYLFTGGEIKYTDWLGINGSSGFTGGYGGFNGTITPGAGVPAQFMEYYLSAEKKYGVDWYSLAAVHFVETGFSTHPTMYSSVGAIGHMQFMPATWVGWKYNIGGGLVSSTLDITSLSVIKSGGGYGVDGCGDGKADPWDVCDAIHTAAHYLSKSNYKNDPRAAIFNYNHATWYVDKVMKAAQGYKNGATYTPADGAMPAITKGDFMRPATGKVNSGYGERWGKLHAGVDIAKVGSANIPIVAVADGVVVKSYLSSSYGNCVIIEHQINGVKYQSLYAHMTGRAVNNGQKVTKGQFLGNMGNTGRSTGPHLHFELHKGEWNKTKSNSVDPVLYIPF